MLECYTRSIQIRWQGGFCPFTCHRSVQACIAARSLLDTQVSNELNLLKSEVRRLRSKAAASWRSCLLETSTRMLNEVNCLHGRFRLCRTRRMIWWTIFDAPRRSC